MLQTYSTKSLHPARRLLMIAAGAVLMALNINTFVHSAGLLPGGFTGVGLLLQEIVRTFAGIELPFSLFYWLLNSIPAIISFRFIGRKFTLYSCMMVLLSGLLTDIIPGPAVTDDVLLCAVFGGLINGCAITLCLFAGATSGGTDFIAIFVSERTGHTAWNYIFAGNCIVLASAGLLFGWNRALYSIIFQFSSTQILNFLYRRYDKTTLLIISDNAEDIYRVILERTNHSATIFHGTGCYGNIPHKLLYTVVNSAEASKLAKEIHQIAPAAFINVLKSKEILGKFFQRPND
ncbi:MAG: YitT family protein [Treponemataceae bacterium]|nr:YitT family protein [Treponemataceae bacterium]